MQKCLTWWQTHDRAGVAALKAMMMTATPATVGSIGIPTNLFNFWKQNGGALPPTQGMLGMGVLAWLGNNWMYVAAGAGGALVLTRVLQKRRARARMGAGKVGLTPNPSFFDPKVTERLRRNYRRLVTQEIAARAAGEYPVQYLIESGMFDHSTGHVPPLPPNDPVFVFAVLDNFTQYFIKHITVHSLWAWAAYVSYAIKRTHQTEAIAAAVVPGLSAAINKLGFHAVEKRLSFHPNIMAMLSKRILSGAAPTWGAWEGLQPNPKERREGWPVPVTVKGEKMKLYPILTIAESRRARVDMSKARKFRVSYQKLSLGELHRSTGKRPWKAISYAGQMKFGTQRGALLSWLKNQMVGELQGPQLPAANPRRSVRDIMDPYGEGQWEEVWDPKTKQYVVAPFGGVAKTKGPQTKAAMRRAGYKYDLYTGEKL
jgi:hypothetical protein